MQHACKLTRTNVYSMFTMHVEVHIFTHSRDLVHAFECSTVCVVSLHVHEVKLKWYCISSEVFCPNFKK